MNVKLIKATRSDMETIWRMQIKAFSELLKKYRDYGVSPACESFERIIEKYEMGGENDYIAYFFDKDIYGSIIVTD